MTRKFNITVDGTTYAVEVEELGADAPVAPSLPRPAAPPAPSPGPTAAPPRAPAPAAAGVGDVTSPLAGTVIEVLVKVGDAVSQGQTVLTLEAMKMNTSITASRSGTVTAVAVGPGTSVAEGQILLSIA
jgi:biotin carboxyl carrier protein